MCSVCVKEGSADVYDLLASPYKHKTGLLRNLGNNNGLKVLLFGKCQHLVGILLIDYDGHTLLGFGNRKLGSVKTRILLRNLVKVYAKACCQLADGNGNTAGTEVVTLLNQVAYLTAAEQSLQLTLGRRITLLYFRTAGIDGFGRMLLRGTGRTAAAVTSGPAAHQNDDVAGIRGLTDYICPRRGAHNGTDFHTLCNIVGMIDFINEAGGKTDLVTVGAVTLCGTRCKFSLGKFAGKRIL